MQGINIEAKPAKNAVKRKPRRELLSCIIKISCGMSLFTVNKKLLENITFQAVFCKIVAKN